jgi:hypothetical protein
MPTLKILSFILLMTVSASVCAVEVPGGGGPRPPTPPGERPDGGVGSGDALPIEEVPGGPGGPGRPQPPPPGPPGDPECLARLGAGKVTERVNSISFGMLNPIPVTGEINNWIQGIKDRLGNIKKFEAEFLVQGTLSTGRYCCSKFNQVLPFTEINANGMVKATLEVYAPFASFAPPPKKIEIRWPKSLGGKNILTVKITLKGGLFVGGNAYGGANINVFTSPGRQLGCDKLQFGMEGVGIIRGGGAFEAEAAVVVGEETGTSVKVLGEAFLESGFRLSYFIKHDFVSPPVVRKSFCIFPVTASIKGEISIKIPSHNGGDDVIKYSYTDKWTVPYLEAGDLSCDQPDWSTGALDRTQEIHLAISED